MGIEIFCWFLLFRILFFQYCLNGKCVAEHENIIPDYTQNIPTYVRREGIYSQAGQARSFYTRYNNSNGDYRWESFIYKLKLFKFWETGNSDEKNESIPLEKLPSYILKAKQTNRSFF